MKTKFSAVKKIHIILIIGLIHGLIYIFIVPPWQHYDEPGHFEYAWLIANRLKLPQVGDYDQNMRLAVGKSLIDSSFFAPGDEPNLNDPSKPIWIGISQVADPPLYYILEAIPFFFLKGAIINFQLYVGRVVSLLFLLITIYSAYKLTQEITPLDHPLQWMVPLFIAMLPGFVEFMTSINDFVAAIGIFSLWLLVAVKLINQFSFRYGGILILLTLASILTQKVLYPIIVYMPIVFLLSVFPQKRKYVAWIVIIAASFIGLLVVFNWGDAAFWLRANYQDFPSRVQVQENGKKTYALQGKTYPDKTWGLKYPSWNPGFFQLVPNEVGNQLRGKTVTIGAWVWSDQNIIGYGPGLNSLRQFQDQWFGFSQEILNGQPQFIASVVELPVQQDRLQIWLRTTTFDIQDSIIYFSGIVLAEGEYPVDSPPKYTDREGSQGIWGNRPFINLARNAQFLHAWPYMEPKIFHTLTITNQDIKPFSISSFFSLFLDISSTKWYTVGTGNVIFHTFWAKFGWGQVPLFSIPNWLHPYRILFIFTTIGIIGALLTGYELVRLNKHAFTFLFIIVVLTFLVALFYGVYTMGGGLRYRVYIPTARYIFTSIIPISLFLVIGWYGLLAWVTSKFNKSFQFGEYIFWGILICLDLFSIASILLYFGKS